MNDRIPVQCDTHHWVKVEFYGLPPDGQTVIGADLQEIGRHLAEVFGFKYIEGLSIVHFR